MKEEMPQTSLQRLPVYLNYLKYSEDPEGYISSGAIARALGMGEVLVRKDLACTSAQGKPRVGYKCSELISAIEDFLGCNKIRPAVIFGAGGLGRALLTYNGFKNYGIDIIAAFDNDSSKIGGVFSGKPVYSYDAAKDTISQYGVRLAIICVPASAAQAVCDLLVSCGIKGILNFAPLSLKVPGDVVVRHIDMAADLAILSSRI